jgi:hypothetical protein
MDRSDTGGNAFVTVEQLEAIYPGGFADYPEELQAILISVDLDGEKVPVANSYKDCFETMISHPNSAIMSEMSVEEQALM